MTRVVCMACMEDGRDGCLQCGLLPALGTTSEMLVDGTPAEAAQPVGNERLDVAQAREIMKRTTPGLWRQGSQETNRIFVPCTDPGCLSLERVLLRANTSFPHEDDVAFIAFAHDFLPMACDRIEALETELARVRAQLAKEPR
jgi:hypothetical protein